MEEKAPSPLALLARAVQLLLLFLPLVASSPAAALCGPFRREVWSRAAEVRFLFRFCLGPP